MAVVFTPLFVAIGLTIAPFLFINEVWQSMTDSLALLSETYTNNDNGSANSVSATFDKFLMQMIRESFTLMSQRLVLCYFLVAIPSAVFSYLYSFIYKKNNSIILMVIVWAVVAASISFLLNKFYFTYTLLTMDHFMGRIIGISLIFGMTFAALIIGILMHKSLKKVLDKDLSIV